MCHDKDSELRHSSIIQEEAKPTQIDMLTQQIEELQKRVRELEDNMYLIKCRSNLLQPAQARYYSRFSEDE